MNFVTSYDAGSFGVVERSNQVWKGDGVGMSWFYDGFNPANDSAVRSETLLRQGTVWAAVNIIAGDVGQIPLTVARRRGDTVDELPGHAVSRVLRDGPNSWQTIDQWLEWMQATAIVWGNAVSRIRRNARNEVVALEPIPPIFLDWGVEDGKPFYYVTAPGYDATYLVPADVVHIKTISTTGFWGMRLAEVAYAELALEKATKRHAANTFERGAMPSGVLQHPGKLGPEARTNLRDEWHAVHGGTRNSGKTAVLWEGMTYNPMSVAPVDAQLIEMLSHDAILVGKLLQISPFLLGDLRHAATRANVEEEFKQYYNKTLRRRVNALANELRRKLLSQPDLEIRPDPTELLKGDKHTQIEVARMAVEGRIWTRNEARRYVGLNPTEGGDVFENPNIDLASGGEPEDDGDTASQARRVEAIEARKIAKQATDSRDFLSYVERFYGKAFGEIAEEETGAAASAFVAYAEQRKNQVLELAGKHTDAGELAEAIRDELTKDAGKGLASYLEWIKTYANA